MATPADHAVVPDATAAATRCQDTTPPSWFTPDATSVAKAFSAIPDSWGSDRNFARVVCFESTYRTSAVNGIYHGLGQMSQSSVTGTGVSWNSYLKGTSAHSVRYYQLEAAFKYCKARYGTPAKAWAHEVNDGWW